MRDSDKTGDEPFDFRGQPEQSDGAERQGPTRKTVEDELREERDRAQRYLDIAGVIFVALDRDGKVTLVNRKACEILGCNQDEIIGRNWFEHFLPQRLREPVGSVFFQLMAGEIEPVEYFENPVLSRDGEERVIAWHNCVLTDESGKIIGTLSSGQDITDRKLAEVALQAEKKKFESVAENAPFGMVMIARDGKFIYVNRKFVKLFGYDPDEIPDGRTWFRKAFPDKAYRSEVISAWIGDLERSGPGEQRPRIFSVTCKDGAERVVHFRPVQLESGEHLMTCEDITERKKAEETIRESEERYRSLFEQSTDAIFIVGPDGKIVDANPPCTELFGAAEEELVGADIRQFYWNPADRQAILEQVDREGSIRGYEWLVKRKDGSQRVCLLNSSVWRDERGEKLGDLSIARDITESRQLEEQLLRAQRMEAVGTLAGGIAHDFNNLLQVIQGYSDIALLGSTKGRSGHAELMEIKEAARSAAELTQGLLTFSRRVESRLRPVNLNHELKNLGRMLTRTIPKMIDIQLRLDDNLATVNADPAHLQQVVMNLAVNARDAMPDGGKLVIETRNVHLDEHYCKTHLGTKPGDYVVLAVSDTGRGMDKDQVKHIFEPFFTTKEAGKGTGLGLSIVYGIVRNHGGNIMCYSEPGQGTTFKIYLPAIAKHRAGGRLADKDEPVGGHETLLLIDDEEPIRRLGAEILSRFGYTVLTADNGREGLQQYKKRQKEISLTILDLIMPEMSGRDCLREILKVNPSAKILVASGYAANGHIDKALEEGAIASIQKPYEAKTFLELVRHVLDD